MGRLLAIPIAKLRLSTALGYWANQYDFLLSVWKLGSMSVSAPGTLPPSLLPSFPLEYYTLVHPE